jgi:6-phospho-beta-glucosidase
VKLTVLGGSTPNTLTLAQALAVALPAVDHLCLWGRSLSRLEAVARACRSHLPGVRVEAQADLAAALEGAWAVLVQVRVGGLAGREFDEIAPRSLGLVGEETLGAGGFWCALRTLPVVRELARAIRAAAPSAFVVNLTNPAGIVTRALLAEGLDPARTFGVCDIPATVVKEALAAVGSAGKPVQWRWQGVNHWGFLTSLVVDGVERVGEAAAALSPDGPLGPVAGPARDLGLVPSPYLRYAYRQDELRQPSHGPRARAAAVRPLMEAASAAIERGDLPAAQEAVAGRNPHWYAEAVLPALCAAASPTPLPRVLMQRASGTSPWLEEACEVSSAGVRGLGPGPALPPDAHALLAAGDAFEALTVRGVLADSTADLRRALLACPLVGTVQAADAVLALARQQGWWGAAHA